MALSDTAAVAALLREYAQRTALRGGNPYRAKAYRRAAESLASLTLPLDPLIRDGRLTEIPGVGEAIADIITKLHRNGTHYFGVTDHSKSAHYAGGLSVEEITAQHREIERLNKSFGKDFQILKGIESDILAGGSLDYPDDVLARFDFVVASIHSRFKLDRMTQTQRIIRAIENPFTTILGHMTGRQLLRRPGYDIDIEAVLAACAAHGVAVEINANPWRLDLDWRWHQRALDLGCMMSINPDAHSTRELDLTQGRRAGELRVELPSPAGAYAILHKRKRLQARVA